MRADLLATAASAPRDCCAACQHKSGDGTAAAASSDAVGAAGTSKTAADVRESAEGKSKTGVKASKVARGSATATETEVPSEERLEPLAAVLLAAIGMRA